MRRRKQEFEKFAATNDWLNKELKKFTPTEAEEGLIGCVLMDNANYLEAHTIGVTREDFGEERTARVWDIITLELQENGSVDMVILASSLGAIKSVFDGSPLIWLTNTTTNLTARNVTHYARLVKEASSRRGIIQAAFRALIDTDRDVFELQEELAKEITHAAIRIHSTGTEAQNGADELLEEARKIVSGEKVVGLIDTGFPTLDAAIGSLERGQVIVFSAKGKRGKSRIMMQVGARACEHYGLGVFQWSGEMGYKECFQNIAQMRSGAPAWLIQTGKCHKESPYAWGSYLESLERMGSWRYKVLSDALTSVDDLRMHVLREKMAGNVDVVLVDYIQLLSGGGKPETRQIEVARVAQMLKNIAMEYDVLMIAGSQMNELGMTRESTNIELAADKTVKLWRDEDEQGNLSGIVNLEILQRRGAPWGRGAGLTLNFDNEVARFTDPRSIVDAPQAVDWSEPTNSF